MPYIKPETILEAKKVDLLSYLRAHEPDELVRCSGGYCTRTHDSLKTSNGMWMWWSMANMCASIWAKTEKCWT
mgnify:CR=1 FL=1